MQILSSLAFFSRPFLVDLKLPDKNNKQHLLGRAYNGADKEKGNL